jgi:hypothetical protein
MEIQAPSRSYLHSGLNRGEDQSNSRQFVESRIIKELQYKARNKLDRHTRCTHGIMRLLIAPRDDRL